MAWLSSDTWFKQQYDSDVTTFDNPYHEDNVDDSSCHVYTENAWLSYLDNGGLDKYYMTMICLSMTVMCWLDSDMLESDI